MRMMRLLASVVVGLGLWAGVAQAAVNIEVDLSTQTMHVTTGSGESYAWPVSTARGGYVTPPGRYGVQSLQTMHYSRKYHNSPMPHSIFFHGGYAIHGTYDVAALGGVASHGCVRLSPDHAAQLFQMVQAEGARISIVGSPGRGSAQVARRQGGARVASARPSRNRVYARRQAAERPLAYAPVQTTPAYDWFEHPFGN